MRFFSAGTRRVSWRGKTQKSRAPGSFVHVFCVEHVSYEKNPGWLFDIEDYTTQLYGDYNRPL